MVATMPSAHAPDKRRRSLDMTDTSSTISGTKASRMTSGFGAVVHRSSQRGSFAEQQHVENTSTEQRKGLGRMLRKAASLRGLEGFSTSLNGDNRTHRNLDLEGSDDSDGPSGVTNFLSLVEPSKEEQQAPVVCAEKPLVDKPKVERKASGGLRGLLRRAVSLRSTEPRKLSNSNEDSDLEPVLVLTDENHGKVIFQKLDAEALSMSMSNLDPILHLSMSDLCGLSTSSSSRSTTRSSSTDSPVPGSKPLQGSFQTAERHSATSGTTMSSVDHDLYVDLETHHANPQGQEQKGSPKGFRGRLRTFFKRTKSGRTVTEEAVGEGPHVFVTSQPSASPMHEITLSELGGVEPAGLQEPPDVEESSESHCRNVMEGLLDVVQEYEDFANQDTRSSYSDDEVDYFGGDDESNLSESDEHFGVTDEEPPEEADAPEALEYFMASYFPGPIEDIQVEPQPARVYDELEIFYEEMTFEHVGGSMLLGAASQLLTVPECDGEECSEDGEEEDETSPMP